MTITANDLDLLRHALGIDPSRPRKLWGFRNYYVGAEAGMDRLVTNGFAIVVTESSATCGGDKVYRATREGCRAVGMTDREIDRMDPAPPKQEGARP